MEKLDMTYFEDTEYSKLDGSETFKAKTYSRVFV
jgi:ribosomal-protein-alanine N-acetyltransferase